MRTTAFITRGVANRIKGELDDKAFDLVRNLPEAEAARSIVSHLNSNASRVPFSTLKDGGMILDAWSVLKDGPEPNLAGKAATYFGKPPEAFAPHVRNHPAVRGALGQNGQTLVVDNLRYAYSLHHADGTTTVDWRFLDLQNPIEQADVVEVYLSRTMERELANILRIDANLVEGELNVGARNAVYSTMGDDAALLTNPALRAVRERVPDSLKVRVPSGLLDEIKGRAPVVVKQVLRGYGDPKHVDGTKKLEWYRIDDLSANHRMRSSIPEGSQPPKTDAPFLSQVR
ncbi:MAG: hypothetical protein HYS81_04470 [Candidatus Aenigmatarchaeota archaeon]|nr:MAG: hypothetical protein HYS81_04470 [Candidatus Aenigmarchaeota archaeon]